VHHGLWDYDPPAAPILMDLSIRQEDGTVKEKKAIAQVTKQAFTFVFDRETGEPVWPIVETSVEASTVDGEKSSPTQPIPVKPAPFDRQGISKDDLVDFSPKLKLAAMAILDGLHYGKLYTPPSATMPTVVLPGVYGGASWAGAAYSPLTGRLYVPSVTQPLQVGLSKPLIGDFKYTSSLLATRFVAGPEGLPLTKPPYGRVTAIDMHDGEHLWMVPSGRGPKDNPALEGLSLPKEDLGWDRRTHVLLTPKLLFTAQSGIMKLGVDSLLEPNAYTVTITDDDPALKALDPETGELLAKIPLPSNAWAAPITYVFQGKQYVVVPYGGANLDAGLIAFALD
jgi:quinoprotein glucose dehydrogenase